MHEETEHGDTPERAPWSKPTARLLRVKAHPPPHLSSGAPSRQIAEKHHNILKNGGEKRLLKCMYNIPPSRRWISKTQAIPSRNLSNLLLQALEYEDALLSRGVPPFSLTILATRTFFYCNWIASCIVLSTMAIKQTNKQKNIAPKRYSEPWAFLCVALFPTLGDLLLALPQAWTMQSCG